MSVTREECISIQGGLRADLVEIKSSIKDMLSLLIETREKVIEVDIRYDADVRNREARRLVESQRLARKRLFAKTASIVVSVCALGWGVATWLVGG